MRLNLSEHVLLPLINKLFERATEDENSATHISQRMGLITVAVMSGLVFLLIPWQVAFLACYIIFFNHCALLVTSHQHSEGRDTFEDTKNQNLLLLLIMTWCLPVVTPVLAVWVRTLATAGLTTPFDGDHNPLNVLAFMALTYIAISVRESMFTRRHRCVANNLLLP